MQYLCLIYLDESRREKMLAGDTEKLYAEYSAFSDEIRKSGHYLGSNPLQAACTAMTVRVRDGKTLTTDGPFTETKEQLGGYYLIAAGDLNEAVRIAARIPGARHGTVEVRPVMQVPGLAG